MDTGQVLCSAAAEEKDVADTLEHIHVLPLHQAADKAPIAIGTDCCGGGGEGDCHNIRICRVLRNSRRDPVLLQIHKLVLEAEGERTERSRFRVLHLERQELGGGDVALRYRTGTIYGLVQ